MFDILTCLEEAIRQSPKRFVRENYFFFSKKINFILL